MTPAASRRRRRLTALLLAAVSLPLAGSAALRGEAPAPDDAKDFCARVAAAWAARDVAGWMRLWDLPTPEARASEESEARGAFEASESTLSWLRAPTLLAPGLLAADAEVFVADEPRARVEYWRFLAERRGSGWALVVRQDVGRLDGLVHLSLAREAWRARGLVLRLEDLELRLEDGTLYASGERVGPTALVFVGNARVRFEPSPPSEREQLREFAGAPRLERAVDWVFLRLHPADYRRLVDVERLVPEPLPEARRAKAEAVFKARSTQSFLLDAPLPRSPWWLLPGVGDALVEFPWRRGRVLTYALSAGESEDVNFFERGRHRQICVYPSSGRPLHYNEDDRRSMDVLDQQLDVRFEPERLELAATHVMRVRPLGGGGTLRLRLDDDFRVSSVQTAEGASLLFFRVRGQNSLVVSLGALGEREQPLTLVIRYAGRHDPAPVDQELVQLSANERLVDEDMFLDRAPIVYSNRTSWYPRPPTEDFAPAQVTFDTPEGWLAVTGGELRSLRTEGRRTRTDFRLAQPGKFLTGVVGRLSDVGLRQEGEQAVRGFATPRLHSQAVEAVQRVQELLAYYARLFGPCPYPTIGVTLAEAPTPGGHSPPGLVYVQQRPVLLHGHLADDPANFADLPDFFLAHETAHQWWGQGTAPASYRERWLSEAWAQYAAALWVRERQGEGAFQGMMDRMARWALRHDPAGPIELGQRLGVLKGDPQIQRAVVYDKGAWVIHMLRGIVGDTAFFAGARSFLQEHRFKKADTDDLRQALEKASGRALAPYFDRWIDGTGMPEIRWSWRSEPGGAGFVTTVDARAEALPGPVPLEVTLLTDAGRETRRVVLDPAGASWTIETLTRARRVSLNEDRGLLARFDRVSRLPAPQR